MNASAARRAGAGALAAAWAAALAAACASSMAPPGAPEDLDPPQLVRATPDSGTTRARLKDAQFQFNEVVAETPRGATSLAQVVLVSPSDGDPVVEWHRSAITVRPRHGWRAATTYVVTLLPGVADLQGNVRDSTAVLVFSTGDSIPRTRVVGAVFDWTKGTVAPRAYVEAHPAGDTVLTFPTKADSAGRFVLPYLTPGDYVIRAILDANNNRKLDTREAWDTVHVQLRDMASVELYTFQHDTIGPRISSVTVVDSLTLRIVFSEPLSTAKDYAPEIAVRTADSTALAVTRVLPWTLMAEVKDAIARAKRDSLALADTSSVNRARREQSRRDSIERAAARADSIARDTTRRTPPPKLSRPALIVEVGVELQKPLVPGARNYVRAKAVGVLGAERSTERNFSLPKPAPPPAEGRGSGRRDSLAVPNRAPPPPRL